MFTQTVEYALRAMVCLASRPEEPQSNSQIAATTKVPSAYLSKVLQKLAKARLVHGQRGVQGGFVLSQPAAEITILQIVSAVDPIQRIRTCPLGLAGARRPALSFAQENGPGSGSGGERLCLDDAGGNSGRTQRQRSAVRFSSAAVRRRSIDRLAWGPIAEPIMSSRLSAAAESGRNRDPARTASG